MLDPDNSINSIQSSLEKALKTMDEIDKMVEAAEAVEDTQLLETMYVLLHEYSEDAVSPEYKKVLDKRAHTIIGTANRVFGEETFEEAINRITTYNLQGE